MLIIAALCLPDDVVDELRAAVTAADARTTPPVLAPPPRRRWLGRAASSSPVTAPELDPKVASWADPIVPIVRFGNLTSTDSGRLRAALADAAAGWEPPEIHLATVASGDADHPLSLRAELAGDVAGLTDIARAVLQRSERLDLYLDRRLFKPVLDVGALRPTTTPEEVEALVATLHTYRGRPWRADHLSVLRQTFLDGSSVTAYAEAYRVPIGPAREMPEVQRATREDNE